MTKQRPRSSIIGLLLGALLGGVIGAVLCLGFQFFIFSPPSSWIPSPLEVELTFAFVLGLVGGGIIGGVLGAIIGATHADRRSAVIIGGVIGLLLATRLLWGGSETAIPAANAMFALSALACCALLGLLIASILKRQYPSPEATPSPKN